MKKIILFFGLLLINCSVVIADLQKDVEISVKNYLSSHFINATFMFADENNTLLTGAKGVFSLQGAQLKAMQQMPIASGTKPMTAAGILRLQDKKMLNVYDPIAKYLNKKSGVWNDGNIPAWAKKIAIHHLLTHTSGIAEYAFNLKLDPSRSLNEMTKDIANFAAAKPLEFEPGSKYQYSNTNFILLGMIIEKISGKTLADFFKDEFFDPLDMKNTYLLDFKESLNIQANPDQMSKYPSRYFVTPANGKPVFTLAKSDFTFLPHADGGIISTSADLIKWNRNLHNGKILSKKSYKQMTNKHYSCEEEFYPKSCFTGYGLFITQLENGDVMYYHPGKAFAIRSESGYIPKRHLYYAIISNVMVNIPEDLKSKIDLTLPENQLDIVYFRQAIINATK